MKTPRPFSAGAFFICAITLRCMQKVREIHLAATDEEALPMPIDNGLPTPPFWPPPRSSCFSPRTSALIFSLGLESTMDLSLLIHAGLSSE
jgi:hypothetical protein